MKPSTLEQRQFRRALFATLGVFAVALGIIGVFVPGIADDGVHHRGVVSVRAKLAEARGMA